VGCRLGIINQEEGHEGFLDTSKKRNQFGIPDADGLGSSFFSPASHGF
jgi:hypothetical protein